VRTVETRETTQTEVRVSMTADSGQPLTARDMDDFVHQVKAYYEKRMLAAVEYDDAYIIEADNGELSAVWTVTEEQEAQIESRKSFERGLSRGA
jgi:hypothetical protein